MSVTPKVSVIIPCYNLGVYLDEAVESVLRQTHQDFEIVIVNDGSTDPRTNALLANYDRPRTRVLSTANQGLSAARNYGIQRSTGPYICALDADDRLDPTCLARSVRLLDSDPSLSFASHWVRTFGDEEREWKPMECDLVALLDRNTINGAALVRRAAVEAMGGFDEGMRDGCEDWDLWLRMVERGLRGTIIPEVLFFYRRRADSMSRAMLREPAYSAVRRRFVQKHEGSYRAHLPELLLRQEARMWGLRVGIHDLRLEHEVWLRPELARHRSEVEVLGLKVERVRREAERARSAAWEELEIALRQAEAKTADLSRRLEERTHEAVGREGEIQALRRSMSWRITRPLRTVHGWLPRSRREG
jgi:glycosyltransferase involved in cell wall biosynthesis